MMGSQLPHQRSAPCKTLLLRYFRTVVNKAKEIFSHYVWNLTGRGPPNRRGVKERMCKEITAIHILCHDTVRKVCCKWKVFVIGNIVEFDTPFLVVSAKFSTSSTDFGQYIRVVLFFRFRRVKELVCACCEVMFPGLVN